MTYQASEESLLIMGQLSHENLETILSSVRSTMIGMLRQGLTTVKISLTASPVESEATAFKLLPDRKE